MQMTALQRARAKEFTMACIVESLAVEAGEVTEDEAVERVCARFFPNIFGADAPRQEPA